MSDSAYAGLFGGRDESGNALRETARLIEAVFLHRSADVTGDTILQEQQAQFMDSAGRSGQSPADSGTVLNGPGMQRNRR